MPLHSALDDPLEGDPGVILLHDERSSLSFRLPERDGDAVCGIIHPNLVNAPTALEMSFKFHAFDLGAAPWAIPLLLLVILHVLGKLQAVEGVVAPCSQSYRTQIQNRDLQRIWQLGCQKLVLQDRLKSSNI